MDTGTSLIYAPPAIAQSMAELIGGVFVPQVQLYLVDCDVELPDLEFTIGGKGITIPGADLMISDDSGSYCFFTISSMNFGSTESTGADLADEIVEQITQLAGSGSGAPSVPEGMDTWLLGDSLLRKIYTVWDFDQEKFGFADLA